MALVLRDTTLATGWPLYRRSYWSACRFNARSTRHGVMGISGMDSPMALATALRIVNVNKRPILTRRVAVLASNRDHATATEMRSNSGIYDLAD